MAGALLLIGCIMHKPLMAFCSFIMALKLSSCFCLAISSNNNGRTVAPHLQTEIQFINSASTFFFFFWLFSLCLLFLIKTSHVHFKLKAAWHKAAKHCADHRNYVGTGNFGHAYSQEKQSMCGLVGRAALADTLTRNIH